MVVSMCGGGASLPSDLYSTECLRVVGLTPVFFFFFSSALISQSCPFPVHTDSAAANTLGLLPFVTLLAPSIPTPVKPVTSVHTASV